MRPRRGAGRRRLSFGDAAPDPARRHPRGAPRGGARRQRARPPGPWPRGSTVSSATSRTSRRPTPPSSRSSRRSDDGLHVLRHSTAHVLAQAVCRLWPGTRLGIGPAIDDGFYYDLEIPAARLLRRPAADRGGDAGDRGGGPAVRPRGGRAGRGAATAGRASRSNARSWTVSRGPDGAADVAAGAETASFYRNGDWEDLCLGPHLPVHRSARRVPSDLGRRRVLAGERGQPAADADLRDRLGHAGGPGGLPRPARGSGAPRPPSSRRRAGPLLLPRGDRVGARRVPSPRRPGADDHGGLLPAAPRRGRATSS